MTAALKSETAIGENTLSDTDTGANWDKPGVGASRVIAHNVQPLWRPRD